MNEVETEDSLHNLLQNMTAELGKLLGNKSETNYPLLYSGRRRFVDVVWKRHEENDPFCVFEIVVKGDLDRAITILKQAYFKWNSKPILVTTDEDKKNKAKRLLESSSPELKGRLKFMNAKEVFEHVRQAKGLEPLTTKLDLKIVLRSRKWSPDFGVDT